MTNDGSCAVDLPGKEGLRKFAHLLFRRILEKRGCPVDLAPVAISTVLSQAEVLLQWGKFQ